MSIVLTAPLGALVATAVLYLQWRIMRRFVGEQRKRYLWPLGGGISMCSIVGIIFGLGLIAHPALWQLWLAYAVVLLGWPHSRWRLVSDHCVGCHRRVWNPSHRHLSGEIMIDDRRHPARMWLHRRCARRWHMHSNLPNTFMVDRETL